MFYLDPPYFEKSSNLYMNFYIDKDHKKLSSFVQTLEKRWIVSYDNNDFILNLYKEPKKVLYDLQQSTSNRIGKEILIFSDRITVENSLENLQDSQFIKM